MASTRTLQTFSKVISKLLIPRELPVAVAVSGGCDSMALTYLATRLFDRVVGITVDHRLREGSSEEANKTRHLVKGLGAEQHTLTLDWGSQGKPPLGKLQVLAREKRYHALLELCRELDIQTLLMGHHLDDQNETFLYRFAMGSGIEGLGGMHPVTTWPGYPQIKIVRPLLELRKRDLVEVCRCEGVEWVEDPTNQTTKYVRNHYRKVLVENPHLVDEIEQLVRSCDEARSIVSKQVHSSVLTLPKIHTKHGYLTIELEKLLSLPSPIAKRVLSCLIRYISNPEHNISYKVLDTVYKNLLSYNGKNMSAGKAVIMPLPKGVIGICRAYTHSERKLTPIRPGETILWENKWEITLRRFKPKTSGQSMSIKSQQHERRQVEGKQSQGDEVYFVRSMLEKDWNYAVRGVRKIRKAILPPPLARPSLPVIVGSDGQVLLIPHFQFYERTVAISAKVIFKPRYSLEDVLVNNYV